jgi:hypothetical protein
MSNICNGKGECLIQTNYENKYEKNQNLVCNHNCQPKKCPLCNKKAPEWYFECHAGVCMNCNMNTVKGKLEN